MRNKIVPAVFCVAMFVAGWLANGYTPSANAQAGNPAPMGKIYQYKVHVCGNSNPNTVADCFNTMSGEGWRLHSTWGNAFAIFER